VKTGESRISSKYGANPTTIRNEGINIPNVATTDPESPYKNTQHKLL
jgi:hypothetical protein